MGSLITRTLQKSLKRPFRFLYWSANSFNHKMCAMDSESLGFYTGRCILDFPPKNFRNSPSNQSVPTFHSHSHCYDRKYGLTIGLKLRRRGREYKTSKTKWHCKEGLKINPEAHLEECITGPLRIFPSIRWKQDLILEKPHIRPVL